MLAISAPSRLAVVAGAAHGAGRECAAQLATLGFQLVLADDDSLALKDVAHGLGATARYCDVGSDSSVQIFVAEVIRQQGIPALLINAAGRSCLRTLGMVRMTVALLPHMRQATGVAAVLNIRDDSPRPGSDPFRYATSSEAVDQLTVSLSDYCRGTPAEIHSCRPDEAADVIATLAMRVKNGGNPQILAKRTAT